MRPAAHLALHHARHASATLDTVAAVSTDGDSFRKVVTGQCVNECFACLNRLVPLSDRIFFLLHVSPKLIEWGAPLSLRS